MRRGRRAAIVVVDNDVDPPDAQQIQRAASTLLSANDIADARDALGEAMDADDVDVGDYLRLAAPALAKLWGASVYNAAVDGTGISNGGTKALMFTTRMELFWVSNPEVSPDEVLFAKAPSQPLPDNLPPTPDNVSFLVAVVRHIAYDGDTKDIWRLSGDSREFLESIWSTAYVAYLDFFGIVSEQGRRLAHETFKRLGGLYDSPGQSVTLNRNAVVNSISNADVRKMQKLALSPDAVELSQLVARNRDAFVQLWQSEYTDRIIALVARIDAKLLVNTARLLQAKARAKIRGEDMEPALLNALTRDDRIRTRTHLRICEGILRDMQRAILQNINQFYPSDSSEKVTYVTVIREIARRNTAQVDLPDTFIGDTIDASWRDVLKNLIVWEFTRSDPVPRSQWVTLRREAEDAHRRRSWFMVDSYTLLTDFVTPSGDGDIDDPVEGALLLYISQWAARRLFTASVPERRTGSYGKLSARLISCQQKLLHLKAVVVLMTRKNKKLGKLMNQIGAIERNYRAPKTVRAFMERAYSIGCDATLCENEAQYLCGGACGDPSKFYCSEGCQVHDWTSGGHRFECGHRE